MSHENRGGFQTGWRSFDTSQRYIESIGLTEQRDITVTKDQYHDPYFYSLMPDLTGKRALDVGCGNFYMGIQQKSLYPSASVVGLDYPNMLLAARNAHQSESEANNGSPVWLVGGAADHLPFRDEAFDYAFSSLLFHWAENPDMIAAEMHRVMKPDATFTVSLAHPDYFKSGQFETNDGHNYNFRRLRDTSQPEQLQVMLNQVIGPVTYYSRPVSEYKKIFESAGFHDVNLEAPVFTNKEKLNQYEHLRRYQKYPLYLFITGAK